MILGGNKGENATILQKKINAVKNNNHKRKYSKRKGSKQNENVCEDERHILEKNNHSRNHGENILNTYT